MSTVSRPQVGQDRTTTGPRTSATVGDAFAR